MAKKLVKRVWNKTIGSELYGLDTNGQMYDTEGKPLDKDYQEELTNKILDYMYHVENEILKKLV